MDGAPQVAGQGSTEQREDLRGRWRSRTGCGRGEEEEPGPWVGAGEGTIQVSVLSLVVSQVILSLTFRPSCSPTEPWEALTDVPSSSPCH